MTYDPDRDARAPDEMNPNVRAEGQPRGMGIGLWLAILVVLALSTFYFFGMDRNGTVATTDRPTAITPSTTGSGVTAPEPGARDGLPNSTAIPGVTPPTVPAPTRQ